MVDPPQGWQKKSAFEAAAEADASTAAGDWVGYLRQNRKWWLAPILTVFVLVGGLLLLSNTVAAPFIYTLF